MGNKVGDIIAENLDKGLNEDWRDHNPELPDKIAREIEDYLKPRILRIIDTLCISLKNLSCGEEK